MPSSLVLITRRPWSSYQFFCYDHHDLVFSVPSMTGLFNYLDHFNDILESCRVEVTFAI
jgi:hypothetical protein